MRYRFVLGAAALAGWLAGVPSQGRAAPDVEGALHALMPGVEHVRRETVTLDTGHIERLRSTLRVPIRERSVVFWIGEAGGKPMGYAVVLDVIGKERPITFLVAVSPAGTVLGVEVLVYRESQGMEIRSPRFRRQFEGKTLADPLTAGRDVDAISGATLSSRSTAFAVKKALALVDVVYRPGVAP